MRRFALLLGVALSLITTSAVAQNCDGFTDVLASSPFCPDVTWMKTYGVTKGCAPSQFCPNDNVSRLQMAAFMHRLGENPAFVNGGNAFGFAAVLGTTDNSQLSFIVNNQLAMRAQPAVDSTYGFNPNVIAGQAGNAVSPGVAGATIAGGGGCNPGTGPCTPASANQVTGTFGTVGGGSDNSAGYYDTVAGGGGNTASGGAGSTVAGGVNNTASADYSTVGGGYINTASGSDSTVAGGYINTASGSVSFAAGYGAKATHDVSFVWSGWGAGGAPSFSPNAAWFGGEHGLGIDYFAQRPDKGGERWVYIGDNISGQTIATWTTASLSDGGNWTNASDRALKADFTAVDAQAVLAKVAQLPIGEWSYKAESGQRHLGPVAQDFYAAFGLGADDKHITTVDEGGVALAAIKGLNAKVEKALDEKNRQLEEQAAIIRGQQREIAELRERVQRAETLAADVVALKAALAELQRGRETVAVK
jgi:hypothetical protein